MEELKETIYKIGKLITIAVVIVALLSGAVAVYFGFQMQEAFAVIVCAAAAIAYRLSGSKKKADTEQENRINEVGAEVHKYAGKALQDKGWLDSIPVQTDQKYSTVWKYNPETKRIRICIRFVTQGRKPLSAEECSLLKEIIQTDLASMFPTVQVFEPYYSSTYQCVELEIPA